MFTSQVTFYSTSSAATDSQKHRKTWELIVRSKRRIANRYNLTTLLGKGGFGEVWEAFDEVMDETVALKVMKSSRATGEQPQDELRSLRSLPRDRFMNAYEFFSDPTIGVVGYSMEPLQPETWTRLDRFVRKGTVLEADGLIGSFSITIALFAELTKTVQFLHHGTPTEGGSCIPLVHGDIKPKNIFVHREEAMAILEGKSGSRPCVKLCDFGLSSHEGEPIRGFTRGYMSPLDREAGTSETGLDLFSIAQSMIFTFTGDTMDAQGLTAERLSKTLHQSVPFQSWRDDLAKMLMRMLHQNASKRPSIGEVASALSKYQSIAPQHWQILRALDAEHPNPVDLESLGFQLLHHHRGPYHGRKRVSKALFLALRSHVRLLMRQGLVVSAGRLRYLLNQ